MALSERPFGLPFGGPSVYLDTSQSEVVDATEGEAALFVPGEEFVLGASRACIKILLPTVAPSLLCSIEGLSADFQKGVDAYGRGGCAGTLREWRPLANQGDAAAQVNLGIMYRFGTCVVEDDVEAVKWPRLSLPRTTWRRECCYRSDLHRRKENYRPIDG